MPVYAPNGYDITTNRIYCEIALLIVQYAMLGEGKYRSMFVQGPPGFGKTFLANKHIPLGGAKIGLVRSSATNLFAALAKYRGSNQVAMFDDFDAIFNSESSMNQMKIASDPLAKVRKIVETYGSKNRTIIYRGRLLFCTNKDMLNNANYSGYKKDLIPHIEALLSRFQLKVSISFDPEAAFHYVCWLATDGAHLLRDYRTEATSARLTLSASNEILEWFAENYPYLKEVSPRFIMEVAHHRLVAPEMWRALAEARLDQSPRKDPASGAEAKPKDPWVLQETGRPSVRQSRGEATNAGA